MYRYKKYGTLEGYVYSDFEEVLTIGLENETLLVVTKDSPYEEPGFIAISELEYMVYKDYCDRNRTKSITELVLENTALKEQQKELQTSLLETQNAINALLGV